MCARVFVSVYIYTRLVVARLGVNLIGRVRNEKKGVGDLLSERQRRRVVFFYGPALERMPNPV